MVTENRIYDVPIWEKYNLTIKEAAEYYNIGENKLRELIKEDNCDFVLYVGKKCLIKCNKFESYLDNMAFL